MSLQQRRTPRTPRISTTPRSFLAASLAFSCALSFSVEPASLAAAKDKRPKQDPVLKGLPITELSSDEAIVHALNRLAYGPRPAMSSISGKWVSKSGSSSN